jgi:hypothetical protein
MARGSDPHGIPGLTERLSEEFAGVLPRETIAHHLDETLARFADAPVTMFVPVIAERVARERLRELARQAS